MSIQALVYGLGLEVSQPLAGLVGLPIPPGVDVTIRLGELPAGYDRACLDEFPTWYATPELNEDGVPNLRVLRARSSGDFYFEYADGTRICVDARGTQVWATWPANATVEDTATYLLGPILGFLLRLRGLTCLHASAVALAERAVLFAGPSGSGKSTTAAAFAQRGFAVLSDDVSALDELGNSFRVRPAYPRIRLWPPAVGMLFGSADALPRLTPTWEKRFLGLNGPGLAFQGDPLSLGAIYFLGDRSADESAPSIHSIKAADAMMKLVSDTYATHLLDPGQRAREFALLGKLVASVPLRQVSHSHDPAKIDDLCTLIIKDYARLV